MSAQLPEPLLQYRTCRGGQHSRRKRQSERSSAASFAGRVQVSAEHDQRHHPDPDKSFGGCFWKRRECQFHFRGPKQILLPAGHASGATVEIFPSSVGCEGVDSALRFQKVRDRSRFRTGEALAATRTQQTLRRSSLPRRPQCGGQYVPRHLRQSHPGSAHSPPALGDGRKNLRLVFYHPGLLLRSQQQHAVAFRLRAQAWQRFFRPPGSQPSQNERLRQPRAELRAMRRKSAAVTSRLLSI